MDHLTVINGAVAGAMIFLALAVTALLAAAWTMIPQINRTLNAYEKLAETLEGELAPTLKEVQKVVIGVGELKAIAGHTVEGVTTKVEDVTGSLGKAASTAKNHSSVFGAGLLAGFRAYLEGKHEHSSLKTVDRGNE
ncbi:MAG TPA: hypothetical protein V6C72_19570 [Chroococcales cyanobacterium]